MAPFATALDGIYKLKYDKAENGLLVVKVNEIILTRIEM